MSGGLPSSSETIVVERRSEGQVGMLTLSRPAVRNAIDRAMARELRLAAEALAADPVLRVLIVTGAGTRAFSAGADLAERRNLSPEQRTAHTLEIEAAAEALAAIPVPTIAAIRGFALAGGAEVAIACDLRVAGNDALLGFPEVGIGIFPGAGGVWRLPPLIGLGHARDLLYTGRRVGATEALEMGLVDRVVDPAATIAEATSLATAIASNAPLAEQAIKHALSQIGGQGPAESRQIVNALRAGLDRTADYAEGLAAFAEKRSPRFTGT